MVPCYRVQKGNLPTGQKKKRGRPKKYSESWTKKLVVLRMCGLNLTDIVRVLEIQGDSTFTAKDRRPQQLVRELLSDGKQRFCTPDKKAARKRAAFIRATLRQTVKRGLNGRRCSPSPTTSSFQAFSTNTADLQLRANKTPHVLDGLPDMPAGDQPRQQPNQSSCGSLKLPSHSEARHRISDFSYFSPWSTKTPFDEDSPATTYDCGQDETSLTHARDNTASNSTVDASISRDSTVLVPSRKHKIRKVFSQTSLSSSIVSDLLSLIDKRFSLSTLETSSRRSVSTFCAADTEMNSTEEKATETLGRLRQTVVKANAALATSCCSRDESCPHRYIERLTATDPLLSSLPPGDLENKLQAVPAAQPPRDSFGNSAIFFAARIGAPADIILSLLNVTNDVNAINADGQTFLFFLNPHLFSDRYCSCPDGQSHQSKFECLIRILERCHYNFDHLDNYGKHFLSFLLSSPAFDVHWLSDLMLRDNIWQQRVQRAAQLRDADGLFIIDFMALHPDFDAIDEGVRSLFRPLFAHDQAQIDHSRILLGEDDKGQTLLHQYLQRDFLHTAPLQELPLLSEDTSFDLNGYSCRGRTPTMDFLLQAFEQDIDESTICAKVQQLRRYGANVDARSRGGSTILQFAAKKAYPKLIETLLASDVQIDHCDNAGLNALDYAAKVFNRSRSFKASAGQTARSLKSAAHLLNVMSHAFGKEPISKDFNERSLQIMQRLLGQEGQRYPPSIPYGAQATMEARKFLMTQRDTDPRSLTF